jgi:hypothetical protein
MVNVTINDGEAATAHLRNEIVPQVKEAPGFVAGYWTRIDGGEAPQGRGTIVFESEDAANAISQRIQEDPPPESAVTINSVDVGEVVEHA